MTIYNTNVAKDYALGAGFKTSWSGIREIIQNALDGHDKGYTMTIEHGKARDRSGAWALKVVNEGVSLTRDALVLGFSTKRNDASARGQHGEGLIVGINALLNYGHEVWIRTGDEAWIAKHERNDNGLEVLVIDIRKQPKYINNFIVEIKGVSPDEWNRYQTRLLFFNDKREKRIQLEGGTILLDPKYKNSLFVKGIYVCELPGTYNFGYDLNIHLNRDREVADPWDLKYTVRNLLVEAVEKDLFDLEDLWIVLSNEGCGESQAFAHTHFWGSSSHFHKKMAENFCEKYGEDAIPVISMGDSQRVEHFGKRGIIVSKALANIIEKETGELNERLKERSLDVKNTYNWHDLSNQEKNNLQLVIDLVSSIDSEAWLSLDHIYVVDFVGETVNGTAQLQKNDNDFVIVRKINISRKILCDRAALLRVLVHEVAHRYGDDGDNNHENEQYRILSEIVVKNLME